MVAAVIYVQNNTKKVWLQQYTAKYSVYTGNMTHQFWTSFTEYQDKVTAILQQTM